MLYGIYIFMATTWPRDPPGVLGVNTKKKGLPRLFGVTRMAGYVLWAWARHSTKKIHHKP